MDETGTHHETEQCFFYHSFPRKWVGKDEEIQKGCRTLELIRDVGLLLTPEIVSWEYPHANGYPPRRLTILQKRVCFTQLELNQLKKHSEVFGNFSLEFKIDVLKSMGALPVFYIPKSRGDDLGTSLGQTLVIQTIDAMSLVDRMARVNQFIKTNNVEGSRQDFKFGYTDNQKVFSLDIAETQKSFAGVAHALTPLPMLSNSLEGMLNFFYPTDDTRDDSILKYYQQREWRITGNLSVQGEELMRRPSKELIDALIELDADFFGKQFPPDRSIITNPSFRNASEDTKLADWIYAYPAIGGKHILELVNRIIVPSDAMDSVKDVVASVSNPPPAVVSAETLS